MKETNKMILGFAVIIGVMVLSYVFFPSNRQSFEGGFNFKDEIDKLQQDISDIDFSGPQSTTTQFSTTSAFSDIEINGPGGCATLEECDEYCSLPEHLEECQDFFGQY